jgi:endonuclease-3
VDYTERAAEIATLLAAEYPDARCELDHETPWQLLVATVLSAQCTDVRVNQVTPELFARWAGPAELAAASQAEVERVIRTTGMFRRKAKALRETARIVVEQHWGEVPESMAALAALPGVGRKTAKVVLCEGFGIAAGVTVDTHVRRLARRLGLTRSEDPEKIAAELEKLIPREEWIRFSTRLILHGRRVCTARAPRCDGCCLNELCPKVGLRPEDVPRLNVER